MNKKTGIILLAAILLVFILLPIIKKQPLNAADILPAVKILAAMAIGFGVKYLGRNRTEKTGGGTDLFALFFSFCVLIAGIISLKHGIWLFKTPYMWKAFLFFLLGMAMVFSFFYLADSGGSQFSFLKPFYRKETAAGIAVKLAIAGGLSAIGTYFIKLDLPIQAIMAFLGAFVQLVLLFRREPAPAPEKEPEAALSDAGLYKKIISVIMIAAAGYLYYLAFISMQKYEIHKTIIFFILGSAFFGLAPAGKGYFAKEAGAAWKNTFDLVFCALIFIAGILIGGYKLMDLPPGVLGDETLTINMASALMHKVTEPIVLDSPGYNGMTLLYYWMLAVAGKIWGMTLETGKWFSVFTGAAELVFVYLIVKEMFNRRAAVLAAVLLSCFFMHVFYSRNALLWIHVPAFASAAYYFFIRALKSGRNRDYVLSGALLAVSVCFYSAGKAGPLVIISYALVMLALNNTRQGIIFNGKNFLLLGLAFIMAFLPIINYIIHFPSLYFTRFQGVSLLPGFPDQYYEWQTLAMNIIKNLQMFITESANGNCHNIPSKPFFDGFASFAAFAGAGYLIFTWKREASLFMLFWVLFGLMPGFLSHLGIEDPYPARTVLAIPAIIIMVSLGIDRALAKLESLWPQVLKAVAPLVIAYFVAWFGYNNLRDYFIVFPNDPHTEVYYHLDQKTVAKKILQNKNEFFFISNHEAPNFYFGMMRGMENRTTGGDSSIFEPSKLYRAGNMDYGIIGDGIYYRTYPLYREYFPDAKVTVVWDHNFWMTDLASPLKKDYGWKYPDKVIEMNISKCWFYSYDAKVRFVALTLLDIPRKDMDAAFTLKMECGKKEGRVSVSVNNSEKILLDRDCENAVISGLLDMPENTGYEFMAQGAEADFYINNAPVKGRVRLYKGLARLKVRIRKAEKDGFQLMWKREGSPGYTVITRNYTLNSDKIFGLNVTYSRDGKTLYKTLEPDINYRAYPDYRRPGYLIGNIPHYDLEWDGYINIEEPAVYEFKMDSYYEAKIMIDGKVVYTKVRDSHNQQSEGNVTKVFLTKGKKKLKITGYFAYISDLVDPGSTIMFLYKKPGHSQFGPVTYDMLSPGF